MSNHLLLIDVMCHRALGPILWFRLVSAGLIDHAFGTVLRMPSPGAIASKRYQNGGPTDSWLSIWQRVKHPGALDP